MPSFANSGFTATSVLLAALLLHLCPGVQAQTAGLGLNPGRVELEANPGQEKTVAFEVEAPPSEVASRFFLTLTPADWTIRPDATVVFADPGQLPDSSAGWVVFSPSTMSIVSGQRHLVRVTVRVPEGTQPGVYRSAIFVQERPPTPQPRVGEHSVQIRFRYGFILYVIVPPVSGRGEFLDVQLDARPTGVAMVCEMKNDGSRHLRPVLSWTIRDSAENEISSIKRYEATVLLPNARVKEEIALGPGLPAGRYEVNARIDFQDGQPVQSLKRTVQLKPPSPPAAAPAADTAKKTAE